MNDPTRLSLLKLYKLGMLMFALQAVYFSFVIYRSYLFQMETASIAPLNDHLFMNWDIVYFSLVFILISIILIFVTYYKLYVPEKEVQASSRRKFWVTSLGVLGCFFGLVIGGLIFAQAYSKLDLLE